MRIFKLISGILLLLFSIMLFLATVSSTLKSLFENTKNPQTSSEYQLSYSAGVIFFFCIMIIAIYFLSKFSLKLIQNKPLKKTDEIDEIGK